MEALRRSLEQVTTPICKTCNIEMVWSRSALVAEEQAILHVSICPRCNRVGEAKTPVQAPSKKKGPQLRRPLLFQNLVLEGNAFGIVFLEPRFSGVGICKHLEVVRISDLPCSYRSGSIRSLVTLAVNPEKSAVSFP